MKKNNHMHDDDCLINLNLCVKNDMHARRSEKKTAESMSLDPFQYNVHKKRLWKKLVSPEFSTREAHEGTSLGVSLRPGEERLE